MSSQSSDAAGNFRVAFAAGPDPGEVHERHLVPMPAPFAVWVWRAYLC